MSSTRLTCLPVKGMGLLRLPSFSIEATGHPYGGMQGNVSERNCKASRQLTLESSSRLSCTNLPDTTLYPRLRRGSQQYFHTSTSSWRPQRLGSKPIAGRLLPHTPASNVTVVCMSMNPSSNEGQIIEESSGSNMEDSFSMSGKSPAVQTGGKVGFVSFFSLGAGKEQPRSTDYQEFEPAYNHRRDWGSLLWLVGPLALVFSVVGPPLYLRRLFESFLEDSLLTDFVILFCTEALFYVGVSLFLLISHKRAVVQRPSIVGALREGASNPTDHPMGYSVSAVVSLGLGVVLPALCFAIVWPWTGPAAAAALLPYLVGLVVQSGFEKIVRSKKSPVWPLVPVMFQVYRIHQLNRAAQLVAGLVYSLKGLEATPETLAINGSLQTLLSVVQLLSILSLWSLGSFLMHYYPSCPQPYQARSLPQT